MGEGEQEWKVPDEKKLSSRIQHALTALYSAEEKLPASEPADSQLRREFTTQIGLLRAKLSRVAGPEALEQFDSSRGAPLTGGEAALTHGGAALTGGGAALTHGGAALTHGGAAGGGVLASGWALRTVPGRLSNEQLAHELALDRTFQLDGSGGSSSEDPLYRQIRNTFHLAFWDSLVGDLRLETPCYVRVLQVVAELREGLDTLRGTRNLGNFMQVVNVDYIRDQAERGLYNWLECRNLITTIFRVVQQVSLCFLLTLCHTSRVLALLMLFANTMLTLCHSSRPLRASWRPPPSGCRCARRWRVRPPWRGPASSARRSSSSWSASTPCGSTPPTPASARSRR